MQSKAEESKMIAVWGSKGVGKTTTAVKIATKLAELKKEVILVLTDITAPDVHILLPTLKDREYTSMGHLWSNIDCKIDMIYKACITIESKYIGILSFKRGDNVFSYPDYAKDNIVDLFMKLKKMADYVVVDCVDVFTYSTLTTVALEMADKVIRLGEATTKSFSFFESNLPLLQDSRYKSSQHYKVLSQVKSYQAREVATLFYGGVQSELPYVEEVELQMLQGELFKECNQKMFQDYNQGLDKILQHIMGTEIEKRKSMVWSKREEEV